MLCGVNQIFKMGKKAKKKAPTKAAPKKGAAKKANTSSKARTTPTPPPPAPHWQPASTPPPQFADDEEVSAGPFGSEDSDLDEEDKEGDARVSEPDPLQMPIVVISPEQADILGRGLRSITNGKGELKDGRISHVVTLMGTLMFATGCGILTGRSLYSYVTSALKANAPVHPDKLLQVLRRFMDKDDKYDDAWIRGVTARAWLYTHAHTHTHTHTQHTRTRARTHSVRRATKKAKVRRRWGMTMSTSGLI